MKNIKIAIISTALLFSFLMPVKEAGAFTEIFISNEDCTITIMLRKEFRVMSRQTLDEALREIDEAIAEAQAVLNPGWVQRQVNRLKRNATLQAEQNQAQQDLNFLNGVRTEVQNTINGYTPMNDAQTETLVQKWKKEIEDKWNAQNYLRDGHCKVRVVVAYVISKESDPPKKGFDQITIVPADYRSNITGVWNFDANGFSQYPYGNDLEGAWSANTTDNYTAPHEAGHEMGLKDRYTDLPGGGTAIEAGYENDLYGGPVPATKAQLGALTVESVGSTGLRVNNLETILNGAGILCPAGGVPQNPKVVVNLPLIPGVKQAERPKEERKEYTPTPPPVTETIQYSKDKLEDVTTDTAIIIRDTPQGKEVDVSTLPTGKSIDFRKWEVKDITLVLDGQKVKPVKKDNFYVDKESYFRGPAAIVITAIGIGYAGYAKDAESGEVCPVTGKKLESQEKGYKQTAAEKAAVAVGVGLIASQAKGTITGKKCSFNLDKETAAKLDGKEDYARVTVMLEDRNIERTINVPLKGK